MKYDKSINTTAKQERLLQVLINPEYRDKTAEEITALARISKRYYYHLLKNKKFQDAVRIAGASLCVSNVNHIINAFIAKGKKGEYQQGRTILQMAGMLEEQPLLHITQNILQNKGLDEQEIDRKIAQYFAGITKDEVDGEITKSDNAQN